MNTRQKIQSVIIGLGLLMLPVEVHAQEVKPGSDAVPSVTQPASKVNLEAKTQIFSKYVLRGFTVIDNPVQQTIVSANYGNVSLIGFHNLDLGTAKTTELDVTADYTNKLGSNTSYSLGYTNLNFFNGVPNSQEIYGTIRVDVLLNPAVTVTKDVGSCKGTCIECTVSQEVKLGSLPVVMTGTYRNNSDWPEKRINQQFVEFAAEAQIYKKGDLTISAGARHIQDIGTGHGKQVYMFGAGLKF